MVKSVILTAAVLAACITFFVFVENYVGGEFADFYDAVEELYEKTESETATQEDARAVRALWEDKRSKLHVFIPHNDISYVDYRLNEALACLYTESYPDALANLEIVMQMAKSVPGNYMIKLENIF